jgi:hypothetical protein
MIFCIINYNFFQNIMYIIPHLYVVKILLLLFFKKFVMRS